jgi:cysteine desulfurase family protein (TIGR01976 family)
VTDANVNTTTGSTSLDVDFVRSQFPAFDQPELADWVHFENAGGSYASAHTIELLTRFYTASKVQPYGPAGPARAGGEAMDRARAVLPATLNCSADELHIGPSTTQNTYVLAKALRATMNDADPASSEVIVTNQDHEANIGAWARLADTGVTVREWSVNSDTGLLELDDLAAMLSERTELVCVTHASNLAATINPIRAVADLVHGVGGLVVVDGVSWAPHAAVDVQELDCDFYLYSTYKTYGPHQGVMYSRRQVLETLANQAHYFKADDPSAWLTPAGPDHAAVAATAGVVDYYDALYRHHVPDGQADPVERVAAVYDLIEAHEEALMIPMIEFLLDRGCTIVGSTDTSRTVRAPTIAFTSDRCEPQAIVEALAADGIGIGYGDFYAARLCQAIGKPEGVARLSMVHYNSIDEVDRAIESLGRVL